MTDASAPAPGHAGSDWRWRLRRVAAMGPAEVLHRVRERMTQPLERRRIAAGWQPRPGHEVAPGTSLFAGAGEACLTAWRERFELDEQRLNALLDGRLALFGYGELDIGAPPDWHRDPVTRVLAPRGYGKGIDYRDASQVGSIKALWELGRHHHLVPLAVAAVTSADPRYAQALREQIESWLDDNPFGRGIHWCSSLEVALRGISWAIVHSVLLLGPYERGLFTLLRDPVRFGCSVYQHAWFVRHGLSRYSSANNHLVGELTGLLALTTVFDLGAQGVGWATMARRELASEADKQVHPDGVGREQAFYYHLWVLEYLILAGVLAERANQPFDSEYEQRIVAMADFLRDMSPAGGPPPAIGDADDGAAMRFALAPVSDPYREVLAVERARRGEPYDTRFEKAFWLGIAATKNLPAAPDTSATARPYPRVYRAGGYAALGHPGFHMVFDAGPLGYLSIAAHGHADALSLCLAIDGDWWLVDPGTYAYHDDPAWRDYFRGTSAHNTVAIDARNQSRIGGAFLWSEHANARLEACDTHADGTQVARGVHDGYRRLGIEHTREIRVHPARETLLLSDRIDGRGRHTLALAFQFAPGINVREEDDGWYATREAGNGPSLKFDTDPAWGWCVKCGETAPIRGWYSAALGQKQPAPMLCAEWQGELPTKLETRIRLLRPDGDIHDE